MQKPLICGCGVNRAHQTYVILHNNKQILNKYCKIFMNNNKKNYFKVLYKKMRVKL